MVRRVLLVALCLATLAGSALARAGRRGEPSPEAGRGAAGRAQAGAGVRRRQPRGPRRLGRRRPGRSIEAAGPAGEVKVARRRTRHRPARHDAPAGPDRPAHARLAPPVRRGLVERPGPEGGAGPARLPCDQPPEEHAAGRVHDDPRPGHRGGRVCRRRPQAGRGPGDRPRPADAGRDPGDRGHGQLCARRASPPSGACPRAPRRPTASTP